MWVTDLTARALASKKIDEERLSNEEADTYYRSLRPEGKYVLAILTDDVRNLIHPLRTSPLAYKGKPEALNPSAIFLQRAEDRESFSRGELGACVYEVKLFGGDDHRDLCFVTFERKTTAGSDLVKNLDDKIEVQFTIEKKKFVLSYRIKDLVTKLEDL